MPKFEEMMEQMGKMSQEEMGKKMGQIQEMCKPYCGECPSYKGTGEEKFGFCAMGKSEIITEEKGCICGKCPVTEMMGLRWGYYCTRGSGREMAASGK